MAKETASSSIEPENNDELEQITIARALLNFRLKEKMTMSNPNAPISFPRRFQLHNSRPTSPQPPHAATSKILPLICQKTAPRSRHLAMAAASSDNSAIRPPSSTLEGRGFCRPRFPAVGAAPYVPIRQMRSCQGMAPPVTIRTAIPVFSPRPVAMPPQVMRPPPVYAAQPINIRQAVPVYAAPPVQKQEPAVPGPASKDDPPTISSSTPNEEEKTDSKTETIPPECETVQSLEQLKI